MASIDGEIAIVTAAAQGIGGVYAAARVAESAKARLSGISDTGATVPAGQAPSMAA